MGTKLLSYEPGSGTAILQMEDGQQQAMHIQPAVVENLKTAWVRDGVATPDQFPDATSPAGVSTPSDVLTASPQALLPTQPEAALPTETAPAGMPPPAAPAAPEAGWTADPGGAPKIGGGLGDGMGQTMSAPLGGVSGIRAVEAKALGDASVGKAALAGVAGEIQDAKTQGLDSIAKQEALDIQKNEAAMGIMTRRNELLGKYQGRLAELQQSHQTDLAQRLAKIDSNVTQLSHMAVNPNKFYQDRGTAATIGMAIAAGLGAFASSSTGSPNYALKIIEDAINRDVNAQVHNIDLKKENILMQDNAYSRAMQMYGRQEDAVIALKASAMESAKNQMEMMTANMAPQEAAIRKANSTALFDEKIAAAKQSLAQTQIAAAGQVNNLLLSAEQTRLSEGWHSLEFQQKMKEQGLDVALPHVQWKARTANDPKGANLPSKEEFQRPGGLRERGGKVEALHAAMGTVQKSLDVLDSLKESGILDKLGANWMQDERYSAVVTQLQGIASILKDTHKFGALDKGVEEFVRQYIGSPLSFRHDIRAKLDAAWGQEVDSWNADLHQFGAKSDLPRSLTPKFVGSGTGPGMGQ